MDKTQLKYTLFGIGFGFLFPLLAIVMDCFVFNVVPFQFSAIWDRMNANPIHYLILLAPIVLGFTFFRIGGSVATRNDLTKRLKRSNKAVKESNVLLDAFNYHVSHDLKTVLNNQLALTQMISKYAKDNNAEKVLEISEKLKDVSENGLTTVLNFLKMSEEGYTHESEAQIHVQNELNRLVVEHGLHHKLMLTIAKAEFEMLTVHPKVFETILLNLLTNAVKYSTQPPVVILELIVENGAKKITVKDNGIGMDLEKIGNQLFKPFNRIENELNKEGHGIGLYLVKKMMLSIGGEIEVKSEVGQGTTFSLIFHPKFKEIE